MNLRTRSEREVGGGNELGSDKFEADLSKASHNWAEANEAISSSEFPMPVLFSHFGQNLMTHG